jgi:RimJ/RimL family protein N-acetyltransferase
MELRRVTPDDYRFLYDLLKEKTPEQNISHVEMPTWGDHVEFNNADPYAEDYIILNDTGIRVGRIYLTRQDEVGIHILKDFQGEGYGWESLQSFLKSHNGPILANIAPGNKKSQRFFERNGFKLIQYTYKFEK